MSERKVDRRWRRAIRWAFFLIVFGALYIGVLRRFSILEIKIATAETMVPALQPGRSHLVDKSPAFALGRDWIVWWRLPDQSDVFSRVIGVPGDVFEQRGRRWLLRLPDGTTSKLRPEVQLGAEWDGRELAPEEYCLLNDRLDARWPDSRTQGPIPRARIVARILFAFGSNSKGP